MKRPILLLLIASTLLINCKGKKKQPQQEKNYTKIGMKYALTTKAVLGKNLIGQLTKNGAVSALSFCNERAYPLTDSVSTAQKVSIKRVSDKYRNPKNQANDKELTYIEKFKKALVNGEKPTPIIDKKDGKVHFYAPIITNAMCLQCHGTPNEQIQPKTFAKIKELYPNDNATGYKANQVRGMWSITFDE
ncbi:MAG: DUF3365 domain-containing protein [Flavobacteriaceae bacterium]|nr:DUF3365 domain-containing protein [Flavobacteriaceae bacterium]